jgi:hypothetical protein
VRGDRIGDHSHQQLVLGWNGAVFEDAFARP